MIDPEVVIAQVKSLKLGPVNLFKMVGGAADYAATQEPGHAMGDGPNAYVVPMADDNQPPKSPNGPQVGVSGVGVVIALTKRGDLLGRKSLDALFPLRQQLIKGLGTFVPAPGYWPLYWRGGRLLDFKTGSIWWLDEFATHYGFATQ